MASVWLNFLKLIQCADTLLNSSNTSRNFFGKNASIQWSVHRHFKKKSVLFMSFLYGIHDKKQKSDSDTKEKIVHNVALATLALKDGNVDKSEKMLMSTLDLAEISNFSLGVISACDMLSSLAIKSGDYEKAEDLLIRALDNLVKQGASEDDNLVVSLNLKLSRIYTKSGNDDLAELGYKNCLRLQKNKLRKSVDEEAFLLLTTILYWYGKFLLSKNRLKEAKSCLLDCYKSSLKVNLLPNQVMVILYNLGEVCLSLGDHDEALMHLLKGMSQDKKCQNPDLTYFYTKLGTILMYKGLFKEAKIWCAQGQKLALRYQNSDAQKESRDCLRNLNYLLAT